MIGFRTFIRGIATEKTLNKITLIGRVGGDAELKGTLDNPVVTFSLATQSGQKTEWHKISVFKPALRTLAESYVKSGSRLYVEGKLSYGHYVSKEGQEVPITSIVADDMIFVSKPNDSQT